MESNLITPSKALGYTDIYLDFVSGTAPARNYYRAPSVEAVAEDIDCRSFDRERIALITREQNLAYGASKKTMANIERLRQPDSLCVFAGQQAGLLGGPLLTLIKALGVVKAAELYSVQLKRPVVPMFWIAGDDHDFEEVNHTTLLDRSGDLQVVAYERKPNVELPTSDIRFDSPEELEHLKRRIKELLGETDFTPALYDVIDRAYTTEDTFVSAFGKLMAALTADLGLVLFSPGDANAKRMAIPFFRDIVKVHDQLREVIEGRNLQIQEAGYHIQVEKKSETTHLFCNRDGRKPVLKESGRFVVGGESLSQDELFRMIESNPELFSPDVITRPLLQSFLFPTVSQKGGPSEIAYLAQINPVFELFDLPSPYYRARPTLTLVEKRFEKLMSEESISLEELTGDVEQVINRILAKSFPKDLEESFLKLKRHLQAHFEDFTETSLDFDPSLKAFAKQTYGKIDFTIKAFEGKVFASHKRRMKEVRERIYRLANAVCPNRGFQERTLNITYFIARYGLGIVGFMYDRMDCDESAHQIIRLSEKD